MDQRCGIDRWPIEPLGNAVRWSPTRSASLPRYYRRCEYKGPPSKRWQGWRLSAASLGWDAIVGSVGDYEYRVQTSETMIDVAATRLMLNRLASANFQTSSESV
jgi:hypothetical protein